MKNPETVERLCKWHRTECPIHVTHYNMLSREASVRSHERVIGEIKRWESETKIFQKAKIKLLNGL